VFPYQINFTLTSLNCLLQDLITFAKVYSFSLTYIYGNCKKLPLKVKYFTFGLILISYTAGIQVDENLIE